MTNYNDSFYADYTARLGDCLTLLPVFKYTRNNSWNFPFAASSDGFFEGAGATLWRYEGDLTALYTAPGLADIRVGGGVIRDEVESIASDGTPGLQLSEDSNDLGSRVHTSSTFGLLQIEKDWSPIGLTLGGRYQDSAFGHAFAPRAGVTYHRRLFHAKVLYGRAFRIPLPWQAYSRV